MAPPVNNNRTRSACPFREAMCKAVSQFCDTMFDMFGDMTRRRLATVMEPLYAHAWRGVSFVRE